MTVLAHFGHLRCQSLRTTSETGDSAPTQTKRHASCSGPRSHTLRATIQNADRPSDTQVHANLILVTRPAYGSRYGGYK